MTHKLVHFTGENYGDVLADIPGYVRGNKHGVDLHIFIPFKGDILIKKNCYIYKHDTDIKIVYD